MKLVDILARDLKEWPSEKWKSVGQSNTGSLFRASDWSFHRDGWTAEKYKMADDWAYAIVTREQWRAAVDARKQILNCQIVGRVKRELPVEWTGEGLPPVGMKVEAYFPSDSKPAWLPTVLLYVSDENVIYSGDEEGEEIRRSRADFNALHVKFRLIRTVEQIAISEMTDIISSKIADEEAAKALFAAGYRKVQP